jgi:outer membrane protein assembly factor BamB
MKTSFLKIFTATIFITAFIGCKKQDFVSAIVSTKQNDEISLHPPLVIQTSSKSFSALNAYNGNIISYFLSAGGDLQNVFNQSPLFTHNLEIDFYGKTIAAKNIKDSSIKWKTEITTENVNGINAYTSYPIIEGNLLMFAFSVRSKPEISGIYALNLLSGKVVWFNNDFAVGTKTIPTFAKNILLVNGDTGYEDGYFFAIDVRTGKIKWAKQNHGVVYAPCTDSNYVYYTKVTFGERQSEDTIFSRDVKNGSMHWFKKVHDISYNCLPAISGNHLYTRSGDTLLCLNKNNGSRLWTFATDYPIFCYSAAYADSNVLYISTNGYENLKMYALNVQDGKEIWSVPVSTGAESAHVDGPVVMHNIVYQRQYPSYITAYNKYTGKLIFKTQIDNYQTVDPGYGPSYIDETGKMFFSGESGMN